MVLVESCCNRFSIIYSPTSRRRIYDDVARGFQAVADREISVGDEVVICLLRSGSGGKDENGSISDDVIDFKLKKQSLFLWFL